MDGSLEGQRHWGFHQWARQDSFCSQTLHQPQTVQENAEIDWSVDNLAREPRENYQNIGRAVKEAHRYLIAGCKVKNSSDALALVVTEGELDNQFWLANGYIC